VLASSVSRKSNNTTTTTLFLKRATMGMKHLAVYMLLKLGGKEAPTADEVKAAMGAVGLAVDEDSLATMMAELDGKDLNELLEQGNAMLAKFGGGGGGGGGGAAGGSGGDAGEEAKAEEPEEEEEAPAGAGGLFGAEEGGDY
jgi:ribosomal protein L12E/L44/L45/RPP1/RPP2